MNRAAVAACLTTLALSACGGAHPNLGEPRIPASLLAGERTIGRGTRFEPPARGPAGSPCRTRLGPTTAAHVELFAADHVVLIGAGVGTRPPRRRIAGRIVAARCYGPVVTLDPTGVVYVRRDITADVAGLFKAWGEPLSAARLASFRAPRGQPVVAFVDGHPWHGPPGAVPLSSHSEIVLEIGPRVPPHRAYDFASGG